MTYTTSFTGYTENYESSSRLKRFQDEVEMRTGYTIKDINRHFDRQGYTIRFFETNDMMFVTDLDCNSLRTSKYQKIQSQTIQSDKIQLVDNDSTHEKNLRTVYYEYILKHLHPC